MDELTSGTGTPTTSPAPSSPPPAQGQATETVATSGVASASTPQSAGTTAATTTEKKGTNLFELPEFRQYQSQAEKRVAEERKRYETQMAQMQQQLRDLQLKGMDEGERIVYERDEAIRTVTQMRQQQEYQQMYSQRMNDIQQLAQISGAPVAELDKAANYAEAATIAMRYQQQNFETRVKSEAEALLEKQKNNAVDLGGGAVQNAADMNSQKIRDAWSSKDPMAFVAALRSERQPKTSRY